MIKYYNIDKHNNILMSEDNKLSSSILQTEFIKEISKSQVFIEDFKMISDKQYCISITYNKQKIQLVMILKNITGAGWKDKPGVKRIQVPNYMINDADNVFLSNNSKLNVILGLYDYDENPLFVGWDAYKYYNHKTLRSCYVTIDSLMQGYKKGYYEGVVYSQKIWVFKGMKFDSFLQSYTNYIKENKLNERC